MLTVLGLEDQVIVALRRITRAIDLHSRGLMQQVGLTAPQLAALQAIGRLQRIAAMLDAEELDAAPVLAAGAATATSKDVSQFLDKAVTPAASAAFPPPDGFSDSSVSSPLADESAPKESQPSS